MNRATTNRATTNRATRLAATLLAAASLAACGHGGRDYEVTVDFDKVGIKKMFAGFAKLKKI